MASLTASAPAGREESNPQARPATMEGTSAADRATARMLLRDVERELAHARLLEARAIVRRREAVRAGYRAGLATSEIASALRVTRQTVHLIQH